MSRCGCLEDHKTDIKGCSGLNLHLLEQSLHRVSEQLTLKPDTFV